ncbi:hypothetical protein WJX79_004162 [Trebouxia sp. C0005]
MQWVKTHYGATCWPSTCIQALSYPSATRSLAGKRRRHGRLPLHSDLGCGGCARQSCCRARSPWFRTSAAQAGAQVKDTPERESNPEVGTKYDEPEAAVLLVACGIGLATGAGVVVFNNAAAAAITLGTGNSLGPEGPSVEIGRTAARGLGNVLKSKQRRLLSLVAAGSGAGVAAGFNAPISGVFFAVETVLQAQGSDLRRNSAETTPGLTIAMVLLASVLAAIVSQAGLGQAPAVRVPDYQLQSILELPLILGFGACCGAVSASFAYSNQVTADLFQRIEQQGVPTPLMPAIGGLVTGLMALQYPEVLYQGFGNVNAILQNRDHFAPLLLFQILAVKILCTSVSKGSGLVGGAYAPSIFMGATLGSAFGGTASLLMTPMGIPVAAPQAYALVGVAAMLAANCQVPLTSVLLLFELTQDYSIILPTLAAVGISYWVASLPAASSAFTPSQFQESDSKSGGSIEDSGYMDALQITKALNVMDEVGQKVALVTNDEGAVVGVLTRESIVKQLAKGPNSTIQKMAE